MNEFDETVDAQLGWTLSPHACRICLGRVLVRQIGGVDEVRCAECNALMAGSHLALCCCGIAYGTSGQILECYLNPTVSKAVSQMVLVRELVTGAAKR